MSPSTDKQILTVNKLILLRFMCKMDIPLTSLHISQFFLERNMMNYFDIQQCISDLLYSKLIQYSNDAKKFYIITQNGRNADKFFSYKIPENIVKAKMCIRDRVNTVAFYVQNGYTLNQFAHFPVLFGKEYDELF